MLGFGGHLYIFTNFIFSVFFLSLSLWFYWSSYFIYSPDPTSTPHPFRWFVSYGLQYISWKLKIEQSLNNNLDVNIYYGERGRRKKKPWIQIICKSEHSEFQSRHFILFSVLELWDNGVSHPGTNQNNKKKDYNFVFYLFFCHFK